MPPSIHFCLIITTLTLTGCGFWGDSPAPTVEPGQVTVVQVIPTPPSFDQEAVLSHIAETVLLDWHQTFATQTEQLDKAVEQFVQKPAEQNLSTIQEQWKTTAKLWAKLELFDFQFTLVLRSQIKKWPANIELIDEVIASDEVIDDAAVAARGSHVKGLAAIEYLIFHPELSAQELAAQLAAEPRRLAYLAGLTATLAQASADLLLVWSPDGQNSIEPFVASNVQNNGIQGSFNILLSAIILQMELAERNKIGFPLRGDDAYAKPDAVESPYANFSIELAKENILAMQQLFEAGLYDYLRHVSSQYDSSTVVQRIEEQFPTTLLALDRISDPLAIAVVNQPKAVADAWEEVKTLSRHFEVDMANHVGLMATFGVNDGD